MAKMKATFMYGPGDVRVEEVERPTVVDPTDAVIKVISTCVCGSDLWPYRGLEGEQNGPRPMGHEYVGLVEEIGSKVKNVKPGDYVVGSFCLSDNTCSVCEDGYPSRCMHGGFVGEAQAEYLRVPLADGTLVVTPSEPTEEQLIDLTAASDVFGTGWFAADEAHAVHKKTVQRDRTQIQRR